jgi:predicted Zn-dependent peptidase
MCLCVAGDVEPERIELIAAEELGKERRPVPAPDFGQAEASMLPAEILHKEAMDVSAPQFLIGAKFRAENGGEAQMRQRLVSQLALRLLVGASSPFYTRLYADGTLSRDFDYSAEFLSGTGTVFLGGESEDPEKVFEELKREATCAAAEGFSAERFERAKRASLGARLRGLEDFGGICVSLATGVFEGYCSLDSIALLGSVTKAECEAFVREALAPERLAISIIDSVHEAKKD